MLNRADFPFFTTHPGVSYLDNAATAQMPQPVIDALIRWYREYHAPIGRSIYAQAERATEFYEQSRAAVAQFIGAQPQEIVFVRGATEGINIVAHSWARHNLSSGDEIILTIMEHHASWVTWHALAHELGLVVRVVPLAADGFSLDYAAYESMLSAKTKLVIFPHISNVLGGILDVSRIVSGARAIGAKTLCDAAQSIAHGVIDAKALNVDFLVFSGHKMGSPEGIGILFCAQSTHDQLVPFHYGGGMVAGVSSKIQYRDMPYRLEAGTPHAAGAYGLKTAIEYLQSYDRPALTEYVHDLTAQARILLEKMPGVRIISDPASSAIISFVHDTIHPHDIAAILGQQGVLVRAGFHCAQPLHESLNLSAGSVRASLYGYNAQRDIEALFNAFKAI